MAKTFYVKDTLYDILAQLMDNTLTLNQLDSHLVRVQSRDGVKIGLLRHVIIPTASGSSQYHILYDYVGDRFKQVMSVEQTHEIVEDWGLVSEASTTEEFRLWVSQLSSRDQLTPIFILLKAFVVQNSAELKHIANQENELNGFNDNPWVIWAVKDEERVNREYNARQSLAAQLSSYITKNQ